MPLSPFLTPKYCSTTHNKLCISFIDWCITCIMCMQLKDHVVCRTQAQAHLLRSEHAAEKALMTSTVL